MSFGITEVDYGEQTPEHFDRFGIRHYVHVFSRHRNQIFVDANLQGTIKRLGLTLFGWSRGYYNVERFSLDINGRPLEIRSYADGRIKLFLDGEPVYTENTKIVTRQWVKHREVEKWHTPRVDQAEAAEAEEKRLAEAEAEMQKRIEAVRERLRRTS